MPIVQVSIDGDTNLGDEFYTFERISSTALQYVCPAKISAELTRKIQDLAVRVSNASGAATWAVSIFAWTEKGNPYVLEINPLPSLDPKDSFNIFPKVIGSSYDAVLNQILGFRAHALRSGAENIRGDSFTIPMRETKRDQFPKYDQYSHS